MEEKYDVEGQARLHEDDVYRDKRGCEKVEHIIETEEEEEETGTIIISSIIIVID